MPVNLTLHILYLFIYLFIYLLILFYFQSIYIKRKTVIVEFASRVYPEKAAHYESIFHLDLQCSKSLYDIASTKCYLFDSADVRFFLLF